ncbi:hypothetical protein OH460_08415 [Vibrio sp. Makdt]|uniref:hypothetical protein n=1 Tax=Vibrio sp. Makdt TaxID=2998828 RepID=UPI0022CD4C58|nr:hypothetical protein [Vibrio sp. Makdt]MDA0152323.1 hypothetical protein [Vibrio sp. Makdt]
MNSSKNSVKARVVYTMFLVALLLVLVSFYSSESTQPNDTNRQLNTEAGALSSRIGFTYDNDVFKSISDTKAYLISSSDLEQINDLATDYKLLSSPFDAVQFDRNSSKSVIGSKVSTELAAYLHVYNDTFTEVKPKIESSMVLVQSKASELQSQRGDLIESQYEHLSYTAIIQDKINILESDEDPDTKLIASLQNELAAATVEADKVVGDIGQISSELTLVESELSVLQSEIVNYENDPESVINSQVFSATIGDFKILVDKALIEFLHQFSLVLGQPDSMDLTSELNSSDVVKVLITFTNDTGDHYFQLLTPTAGTDVLYVDFDNATHIDNPDYVALRGFL